MPNKRTPRKKIWIDIIDDKPLRAIKKCVDKLRKARNSIARSLMTGKKPHPAIAELEKAMKILVILLDAHAADWE
jgi:hypothetical protein